jgi:hypothetical protein
MCDSTRNNRTILHKANNMTTRRIVATVSVISAIVCALVVLFIRYCQHVESDADESRAVCYRAITEGQHEAAIISAFGQPFSVQKLSGLLAEGDLGRKQTCDVYIKSWNYSSHRTFWAYVDEYGLVLRVGPIATYR